MKQILEIIRLFINIWGKGHEKNDTTELVQAIIKNEAIKTRRLADIFHVNIDDLKIMWIISLKKTKSSAISKYLLAIKKSLEQHRLQGISDLSGEQIVVFIKKPAYAINFEHLAESFLSSADTVDQVAIVINPKLANMDDARATLQLSDDYLNQTRIIYPHKNIFSVYELAYTQKCFEIINQGENVIQKNLAPILSFQLPDENWQKELIHTLFTFLLDTQNSISKTAELLFVHKSTIKYRIKTLNEMLGYSIQKQPEAYPLYLAAALYRLVQNSD